MKKITIYYLIITFIMLLFSSQSIFSQTTYDYFEKQRLERKEKKVKVIYYDNKDFPSKKNYFDKDGNITKSELFSGRKENGAYKLWREIFIRKIDSRGNLSGIMKEYRDNNVVQEIFSEIQPVVFFEIGIFNENLVEEIRYFFDFNGNVTEKRSYGDHAYPKEYTSEIYNYENGKVKTIVDSDFNYKNILYYDDNGLLYKIEYDNTQSDDYDSMEYIYYDFY
jgi:hypothetical protein